MFFIQDGDGGTEGDDEHEETMAQEIEEEEEEEDEEDEEEISSPPSGMGKPKHMLTESSTLPTPVEKNKNLKQK